MEFRSEAVLFLNINFLLSHVSASFISAMSANFILQKGYVNWISETAACFNKSPSLKKEKQGCSFYT